MHLPLCFFNKSKHDTGTMVKYNLFKQGRDYTQRALFFSTIPAQAAPISLKQRNIKCWSSCHLFSAEIYFLTSEEALPLRPHEGAIRLAPSAPPSDAFHALLGCLLQPPARLPTRVACSYLKEGKTCIEIDDFEKKCAHDISSSY